MKKLRLQQVSGSSCYAGRNGDIVADGVLKDAGFVDREGRDSGILYKECFPARGTKLFVYYEEPAPGSEQGAFRLVKDDGAGNENVIDRGTAMAMGLHRGFGPMTFSGRGTNLRLWWFHCEQEPVADGLECNLSPRILVIQTSSTGPGLVEEVMNELGLREDVDYRFVDFNQNVVDLICAEGRCLFITGTRRGDDQPATRLIRQIKAKNPQVFCVGLTVMKDIPGVDMSIKMEGVDQTQRQIKEVVTTFLKA